MPDYVASAASLHRYEAVSVFNQSNGGIADTYVVPLERDVVMTTGAMATFAPKSSFVCVASYTESIKRIEPTIYSK